MGNRYTVANGIIIFAGCWAIGHVIMPVFHDPWSYYITALAFNSLWCYIVLKGK